MKLTTAQSTMLAFIKVYIAKFYFPPTISEIASGLGYSSTNAVSDGLKLLEREGAIKRIPRIARGIVLVNT